MMRTSLKGTLVVSLFILASIGFHSCAYTAKSATALLQHAETEKYDMVIVPGVPFENGKWSNIMKGRVFWSLYLYKKGIAKNIMYSGNAVYTPYKEAEIMALYAEKLGISRENIFTETFAEHSTENIYYSYKKARMLGFSKIALASDPFQTRMLKRFVQKKVDPSVGFVPIVFDTLSAMETYMTDPDIDAQKALVTGFVPLTERQGLLKRFRGTRGMAIDTTYYSSLER